MSDPRLRNIRSLDLESVKVLAHPLRVQLLEAITTFGADTASGLAERLGESSGATSYHLRQLAKHGFVVEVEGRGSGRERWWDRPPIGLNLNVTDFDARSPERAAAEAISRQWDRSRAALLDDFTSRGPVEIEKEWYDSSAINHLNVRLTIEQLRELVAEIEAITERYATLHKKQGVPGTRPVQIHFNAFPIVGESVLPDAAEMSAADRRLTSDEGKKP